MKNFFLKFKYFFLGLAFAALAVASVASADVTANFWQKAANGQLYTNSGNGIGQAIINVAGCNGCGGGGVPAGLTTEVQYNNAGAFGSDVDFVRAIDRSYFQVKSEFAPSVQTLFLQDVNLFGIGIDGVFNGYSANGFVTNFTGTLAGDFTGIGGADNSMIVGHQSFAGGAVATTNYLYNTATNEAQTRIEASTLTRQARINIEATALASTIDFEFGGSNRYQFPSTEPTVGTVLGYAGVNTLDWVSPSSPLTIGDAITGGAVNRILYENGTNTLQESSDLGFVDSSGRFHVSFAASNRLLINPASDQYYIGNGGTGDTLVELLDVGGGSSVIRNWVTGSFLVQQGNAGPRLIDGNTSTFALYLGDVGGNANDTRIEMVDAIKAINIIAHTAGGSGGLIKIGDSISAGNDTMMQLDDFSGQMFVQTNGDFGVQTIAGARALNVNFAGGTDFIFEAGDANSVLNGTKLQVTDSSEKIVLNGAEVNTVQYATPLTGATVTVTAKVNRLVLEPAAAILAVTINLPSSPANGQYFNYVTTQAITTVTLANGTVVGAEFSGIGGQNLVYVGSQAKWYVMP